jgi:cysteine desulfurase family protein (TIGR01976 family)
MGYPGAAMADSTAALDVEAVRRQFPALSAGTLFLDGPAGSQVPGRVLEAVTGYLRETNANSGGTFSRTRATDALVAEAREAVAELLGTGAPEAVAFGPNMTTLTFGLSRALARTWHAGDEVVVTRLDHDANVWPWVLAARDAGATVRHVPFRAADCTLDLEALEAAISARTRLVAVGAASNAVGTVNPVSTIAAAAHRHGAQLFVDAVHYAPHRRIDLRAWDCDYVVCSAYKFFGPHVGILWGRPELLTALPAYQVRPADHDVGQRFMTGTPSFEGIAGTLAAIDYLCALGGGGPDRRAALDRAFAAITAHEDALCRQLLAGLAAILEIRIHGVADPARLSERVATAAITHARLPAPELARRLAAREIQVWSGHFYAVEVTAALGLGEDGLLRIGLLHYNTEAEVDRLLQALRDP